MYTRRRDQAAEVGPLDLEATRYPDRFEQPPERAVFVSDVRREILPRVPSGRVRGRATKPSGKHGFCLHWLEVVNDVVQSQDASGAHHCCHPGQRRRFGGRQPIRCWTGCRRVACGMQIFMPRLSSARVSTPEAIWGLAVGPDGSVWYDAARSTGRLRPDGMNTSYD